MYMGVVVINWWWLICGGSVARITQGDALR